tara:strand:- start:274 stop:870 length:597 start_codon:yes stop_codon:yes gene_type:complete
MSKLATERYYMPQHSRKDAKEELQLFFEEVKAQAQNSLILAEQFTRARTIIYLYDRQTPSLPALEQASQEYFVQYVSLSQTIAKHRAAIETLNRFRIAPRADMKLHEIITELNETFASTQPDTPYFKFVDACTTLQAYAKDFQASAPANYQNEPLNHALEAFRACSTMDVLSSTNRMQTHLANASKFLANAQVAVRTW